MDGTSSLTSRYVYGDGVAQPLARIDVASPNVTRWLLVDHLGSIRDVIDNTATVKDALAFDPFGNITSESNSANRGLLGYTASFTDNSTTLQLHSRRWYDPARGGWQTPDPMGFAAGDTNLYRYVGNNPTDGSIPREKS